MNDKNIKSKSSHQFIPKIYKTSPLYFLPLCIIILPILAVLLIIFALLTQLVNIILKLKYGKSYGGLLTSADTVWVIEDVSRTIINCVLLVEIESSKQKNIFEEIKTAVYNKIFKHPENFQKLTSIRQQFLGYNFLLKYKFTVNDCVKILEMEKHDNISDENILQMALSKYSNQPLPKDNHALWEVLVSSEIIRLHSHQGYNQYYPVLIRFSHVVGDGISLTGLLSEIFGDGKNLIGIKPIHNRKVLNYSSNKNIIINYFSLLLNFAKDIFVFLHIILISPVIFLRSTFLRDEDVNGLRKTKLSGEKNLVFSIEKTEGLISVIKDVKKLVPGSTFSDILFTAISKSLETHFIQNSEVVPQFVTLGVPALLSFPKLEDKVVLKNQFSIGFLDLPVLTESKSMLDKLENVIQQTRILRNSPEYMVNFLLLTKFCGIIPEPILRLMLRTDKLTMCVSNMPGINKMPVLNGRNVGHVICYVPHRGTAGIGLLFMTYDNRFQLALGVDKAVISSPEKCQIILENIFESINLLYEEVSELHSLKNK